jgi:hypothetical protein
MGVVVIGSGDDNNHTGIFVTATIPRTMTTMMSWLGSWWGRDEGNNVVVSDVDSGIFWFGLSPL